MFVKLIKIVVKVASAVFHSIFVQAVSIKIAPKVEQLCRMKYENVLFVQAFGEFKEIKKAIRNLVLVE